MPVFTHESSRRVARAVRAQLRQNFDRSGRRRRFVGAGGDTLLVVFNGATGTPGVYDGLEVKGAAGNLAKATFGYDTGAGSWNALPTSNPGGGQLYTGAACVIINIPDLSLGAGLNPIPNNQPARGFAPGWRTAATDTPANALIVYCEAIAPCAGGS